MDQKLEQIKPNLSAVLGNVKKLLIVVCLVCVGLVLAYFMIFYHPAQKQRHIKIATTTSIANSGLLDHLIEQFRGETGIQIHYIPVGTGKALQHGKRGNVEAVFTHDVEAETQFVKEEHGLKRVLIMWNEFLLLGPAEDPAKIRDVRDAAEVFRRIAKAQHPFISRGDQSGTHKRELTLWVMADLQPRGSWYIEAGQGMAECLVMANEKRAYILSDRGSYLAMQERVSLIPLWERDALLYNPYSIIAVNPKRYPELNHTDTQTLINWLLSESIQRKIGEFKISAQSLFYPMSAAQKTLQQHKRTPLP
jgi:tungstate transport system substrate-binding protein